MKNEIIHGCLVTFSSQLANKTATYVNKVHLLCSKFKNIFHTLSFSCCFSDKRLKSGNKNYFSTYFMSAKRKLTSFSPEFPLTGLWRVSCRSLGVNAFRLFWTRD